ncbi:hypothetical protein BDN72DRAFT_959358 [Pluteus cervinus]|uniref:Uncharacterized protein n=1 Tax=Pluteus cervinus TaxID=181527 RepID=A0ACD3AVL3_9AGAR|nr:hypothetical protein BDN72DRAFT_959358 [Pluteus cervinus]
MSVESQSGDSDRQGHEFAEAGVFSLQKQNVLVKGPPWENIPSLVCVTQPAHLELVISIMASSLQLYPDPRVDDRQKIDEEIAQLEGRIVLLKVARNDLAPVACLHSEILQEIFLLIHLSDPNRGKASLLVTWVSHAWRQLAHDTSALWSYVDFTHREWVDAALSHTKNRELEFDIHRETWRRMEQSPKDLVEVCLGNISRVKKLKIVSKFHRAMTAFPELAREWLTPAPVLVELHLQYISLPPNTFSATSPSLQLLHLSLCIMDWETLPISGGLKNLVIFSPRVLTTVDNVVKILQTIGPSLEVLHLQNVFYSPLITAYDPHGDRIPFENINSLHLELSEAKIFERLLNQISLPPRLTLEITFPEWVEADLSMVRALVSSRNVKKWPIVYLEIKIEDNPLTLRIMEDWSKIHGHPGVKSGDDRTHVRLEISNLDFNEPSRFLPIFDLLPIQPIETVVFVGGFHEPQDWKIVDFIGRLGTVRELSVEDPFLASFISWIHDQEDKLRAVLKLDKWGDISEPCDAERIVLVQNIIPFHSLCTLEIYADLYDGYTLTNEDVRALEKWLKWRKWADLRLDKLLLSGLKTPPIRWMNEIFNGIVGKLQPTDLEEIENS